MAGTVDVPGLGAVDKRVLYGIGAATAAAIGYVYWRKSQAPPVDPAALEYDEGGLLDTGEFGGGSAWSFAPTPNGDVGVDASAASIPRTNADWTKQAVEWLSSVGRDAGAAADALGKYLAGEKLSAEQVTMVQAAIGGVGQAPQGSYSIIRDTSTATPTPTASKPGRPVPGARSVSRASITVGWAAVPGATSYKITKPSGEVVTQTGTSLTVGGLKKNVRYRFMVSAVNSAGESAPAELLARTAA